MKTFYVYEVASGKRRKFVAEVKAENVDQLRKLVARDHPKLTAWDALRPKYVKDKRTGEIKLPPRGDKEDT